MSKKPQKAAAFRHQTELTGNLEDFLNFAVGKIADPGLACGDRHIGQFLFALNHFVELFFERAFCDEAIDDYVAVLSNAVGAVICLSFDGRIPPQVVMDDGRS